MSDVQDAIHRAIPVTRDDGLSGAMYEAKTSADIEGYVVDVADWKTITKTARRAANPDLIGMGIVAYQIKDYNPFTKDEWQEIFDAALGVTEEE